ncbi:MAG: cation diffusion facilitator family transporter, partial [Deltaproteobacteria bacterium]|nr:cation diffusion facilitator family transporter [Deltaproteobacteria bacterium]
MLHFFSDKKHVAWLSVGSNTLLTAGKLAAGLATGSVSILSEAAHSAMDLLAAGIATFSVHVADRPADASHPYGHDKVENVSGVIEGLLVFLAAAWIVYEAVDKLLHGTEIRFLGHGLIVMAVSAIVNLAVATLLKRSAVRNRSVALEADAAHLYTDVYTSAGVFAGLSAISMGRHVFSVELAWLDPVIAIGVALLILSAACRITRKSFLPLMDSPASPEELSAITAVTDGFSAQGADFHKLRTRRAGGSLHVDLHMGCRPGVSLEQGHEISHRVKARIEESVPGARVLIHVEPASSIEVLAETDEQVRCMKEELIKDSRVQSVQDLRAQRYRGDLRIEAELSLDPKVTLAESHVLTRELKERLESCFPEVKETVLSLHPADGWQSAIHEDDRERIRKLVGEHESRFAGIHELEVASAGGMHRIHLSLGVPHALPVSEADAVARHIEKDIREL